MLLSGELPWFASPGMPAWPSCLSANGLEGCRNLLPSDRHLLCSAMQVACGKVCCAFDVLQSQVAAPWQLSLCALICAFIRFIINTHSSMLIHLCVRSFGYLLIHSFVHSIHNMSSIFHAAMALQLGPLIGCMAFQSGPSIGCMALQVHQGRPHRAGLLHPDCQRYPTRAVRPAQPLHLPHLPYHGQAGALSHASTLHILQMYHTLYCSPC